MTRFWAFELKTRKIKASLGVTNQKTCQSEDKKSFQPVTDMVKLIGYVVTGTGCLYIRHKFIQGGQGLYA